MGRSITQSNIATNLSPHLQAGTPKHLRSGEGRACYAICSWNTSTAASGISWLDKFFQPVVPTAYDNAPNTGSDTNNMLLSDSTWQYIAQVFGNMSPTQSPPTSSPTSNYGNATNAAGEFGNITCDLFSNRTAIRATTRSTSNNVKHVLNQSFVNSDHTDKSIVYILHNGTFRAVSRIDGDFSYNRRNTKEYAISGVNSSMRGSASYNNVLKRLVVLSYNASGGSNTLSVFNGIDFDKYPSPAAAFAASAVTRTDIGAFTIGGGTNWNTSDAESYYNLKPVLCDNGQVYVTVMFTSSIFSLYQITLNAGLTAVSNTTYISQKTLASTSYGLAQALEYGQRQIQSRDGGAVLSFCPSYCYGSGILTWLVDKRKSTYISPSAFDSTSTSYGLQPLPYGDDGFACYYAGNYYANNANGAYITGSLQRNGLGNFEQTGSNIYLPYAPPPNTTNYPFITQVVDYSMLDNQNVI